MRSLALPEGRLRMRPRPISAGTRRCGGWPSGLQLDCVAASEERGFIRRAQRRAKCRGQVALTGYTPTAEHWLRRGPRPAAANADPAKRRVCFDATCSLPVEEDFLIGLLRPHYPRFLDFLAMRFCD